MIFFYILYLATLPPLMIFGGSWLFGRLTAYSLRKASELPRSLNDQLVRRGADVVGTIESKQSEGAYMRHEWGMTIRYCFAGDSFCERISVDDPTYFHHQVGDCVALLVDRVTPLSFAPKGMVDYPEN